MTNSECEWKSIERGSVKGASYSILRCSLCGREASVIHGKKVNRESEIFLCPLDLKGGSRG